MSRRKSRWAVRREKAVIGDLTEWPLSTSYDIAERLRLDPHQIAGTLDTLLAERRITEHWIEIPVVDRIAVLGFMRNHRQICHWALPDFDTRIDALTADQPDKERP